MSSTWQHRWSASAWHSLKTFGPGTRDAIAETAAALPGDDLAIELQPPPYGEEVAALATSPTSFLAHYAVGAAETGVAPGGAGVGGETEELFVVYCIGFGIKTGRGVGEGDAADAHAAEAGAGGARRGPDVDDAEPSLTLQQQVFVYEVCKRRHLSTVREKLVCILAALPVEYLWKSLERRVDGRSGSVLLGEGGDSFSWHHNVLAGARRIPGLLGLADVGAAERARFFPNCEVLEDSSDLDGIGGNGRVVSAGARGDLHGQERAISTLTGGDGMEGAGQSQSVGLEELTEEQQTALDSAGEGGGPVFISGRSGSGKTTVLLRCVLQVVAQGHGLNANEDHAADLSAVGPLPAALVVTQGALLAETLREKFRRFSGLSTTTARPSSSGLLAMGDEWSSRCGAGHRSAAAPRPLRSGDPAGASVVFVSYNELLLMIDAALTSVDGQPFFGETRRQSSKKTKMPIGDRLLLVRARPADHFRRVGGTMSSFSASAGGGSFEARAEVGFPEFASRYWPVITASVTSELRKGKRRGAVVAQFSAQDGYRHIMALKEQSPSISSNPAMDTSSSREELLSEAETAFLVPALQKYNQLLRKNMAFDVLDAVANLAVRCVCHQRLFGGSILSLAKFNNVLVDEAQDLLVSQIQLLQHLSAHQTSRPSTNFSIGELSSSTPGRSVFCADAAQSIMLGRRFSFCRLKDLYWAQRFSGGGASPRGDAPAATKGRPCSSLSNNLHVHQLTVNFRSQPGILKFANALIDVLSTCFGAEMDKLARERGAPVIGAEKTPEAEALRVRNSTPYLITGYSENEFWGRLLGDGGLGADQVVLVRDESSRERIQRIFEGIAEDKGGPLSGVDCLLTPEEVSGRPLPAVLTVLEAKGMEFEDVVLVDFFGSSSELVARQYLSLYTYLRRLIKKAAEEKNGGLKKLVAEIVAAAKLSRGSSASSAAGTSSGSGAPDVAGTMARFRSELRQFDDILEELETLEARALEGKMVRGFWDY